MISNWLEIVQTSLQRPFASVFQSKPVCSMQHTDLVGASLLLLLQTRNSQYMGRILRISLRNIENVTCSLYKCSGHGECCARKKRVGQTGRRWQQGCYLWVGKKNAEISQKRNHVKISDLWKKKGSGEEETSKPIKETSLKNEKIPLRNVARKNVARENVKVDGSSITLCFLFKEDKVKDLLQYRVIISLFSESHQYNRNKIRLTSMKEWNILNHWNSFKFSIKVVV